METGRVVDLSPGGRSQAALAPTAWPAWRRRIFLILAWLAGPALLWWAVSRVPFAEFGAALTELNGTEIGILAGLNAAIIVLMGGRWWLILRAMGHPVSLLAAALYRLAGFGVSYITPGPQVGGETLQVLLLKQRKGVPAETALASVYLDRLLELLVNLTFLVFGLVAAVSAGLLTRPASAVAWIPAVVILILPLLHLLALRFGKLPATFLFSLAASRLKAAGGKWTAAAHFVQTSEQKIGEFVRERPGTFFMALALSVISWAAVIFEYRLVLSFLQVDASLLHAVSALTAARLAFLTGVPGGLGTLEASQVMAMQALGFSAAQGLSVGLLIRGRDVLVSGAGLLIGGILWRNQMQRAVQRKFGVLQVGIALLTFLTALIHFSLLFPDPVFILNGLGYLALLAGLYAPLPVVSEHRRLVRFVFIGYTILTIFLFFVMNTTYSTMGLATKAIEAALVVLLLFERP